MAEPIINNEKSNFIIISYYWGDGNVNKGSIHGLTYGQQVQRIKADMDKLKINYYIEERKEFEKKGSYMEALSYKTEFIKECIKKFEGQFKNLIFLDTDLRILKYPELFEAEYDCFFINNKQIDFSCFNIYQLILSGAILGFSTSTNSKKLLELLDSTIKKHRNLAEDKLFSGLITRNFLTIPLRCMWLPMNYLYMFSKHVYSPEEGRYTHVASYKEEFEDEFYKQNEVVIAHEDFETGELSDIWAKRVEKNRFPKFFYRQQGEKLRCVKNKDLIIYKDYGLTNKQYSQVKKDYEERSEEKEYSIKKVRDITIPYKKYKIYKEIKNSSKKMYVITLIDKKTSQDKINKFEEMCNKLKLNYIIFKQNSKVNLPQLFYNIIRKYKNIRYISIDTEFDRYPKYFDIKNIDFFVPNQNSDITQSKCYDPRFLRLKNQNIFCFNYSKVTLQFLKIWYSHNTQNNLDCQYYSCEKAFNSSFSINILRCFWLPSEYNIGGKGKCGLLNERIDKKLKQCGIKPSLNNGYISPAHKRGSRKGHPVKNPRRILKKFIEI